MVSFEMSDRKSDLARILARVPFIGHSKKGNEAASFSTLVDGVIDIGSTKDTQILAANYEFAEGSVETVVNSTSRDDVEISRDVPTCTVVDESTTAESKEMGGLLLDLTEGVPNKSSFFGLSKDAWGLSPYSRSTFILEEGNGSDKLPSVLEFKTMNTKVLRYN